KLLFLLIQAFVCQPGCICAEPSNWETEDLVLPCLKEVAINGLRGTEHELALVERLFKWATMLERVTVIFHDSISESNGEEFRQLLLSFSRPAICMKFSHGGGSLSFD
uniref:FBD domain-containing protein n=1 Tax=Aegilops tauschii subsp. strangulata TaxID=200361 RepID=A0A453T5B4_AEGTS